MEEIARSWSTVYDEDGQLSPARQDYCLPRANQLSAFDIGFHQVPATTNPLGVKGCGEAGVAGSMPTLVNAVLDALAPLGVTQLDMPLTPERVWRAIEEAAGQAASMRCAGLQVRGLMRLAHGQTRAIS